VFVGGLCLWEASVHLRGSVRLSRVRRGYEGIYYEISSDICRQASSTAASAQFKVTLTEDVPSACFRVDFARTPGCHGALSRALRVHSTTGNFCVLR